MHIVWAVMGERSMFRVDGVVLLFVIHQKYHTLSICQDLVKHQKCELCGNVDLVVCHGEKSTWFKPKKEFAYCIFFKPFHWVIRQNYPSLSKHRHNSAITVHRHYFNCSLFLSKHAAMHRSWEILTALWLHADDGLRLLLHFMCDSFESPTLLCTTPLTMAGGLLPLQLRWCQACMSRTTSRHSTGYARDK